MASNCGCSGLSWREISTAVKFRCSFQLFPHFLFETVVTELSVTIIRNGAQVFEKFFCESLDLINLHVVYWVAIRSFYKARHCSVTCWCSHGREVKDGRPMPVLYERKFSCCYPSFRCTNLILSVLMPVLGQIVAFWQPVHFKFLHSQTKHQAIVVWHVKHIYQLEMLTIPWRQSFLSVIIKSPIGKWIIVWG